MKKKVIIYISPDYVNNEDFSPCDVAAMTEQERYTWAKNVSVDGVDIYYSLDSFCDAFNEQWYISDLGYIYVGETLI